MWLKKKIEEVYLESHCAFSSKLVYGHIVQKYIDQMSPPENKKCSPGKVFGIKPPSKLVTFEQESPYSYHYNIRPVRWAELAVQS